MAKTLRSVYAESKEATEFLKLHPEMAGADLEETVRTPDGKETTFYEREESRTTEMALKIQEALPHYPDRAIAKFLENYFEGETMKQLARRLKRGLGATRVQLQRWRAAVYLWSLSRPWETKRLGPADLCTERKRLVYGKERRDVFRVNDVWVDGEWNVFPPETQAVLDGLEWEFLDLGVKE